MMKERKDGMAPNGGDYSEIFEPSEKKAKKTA
jgi:hypothetical protein